MTAEYKISGVKVGGLSRGSRECGTVLAKHSEYAGTCRMSG